MLPFPDIPDYFNKLKNKLQKAQNKLKQVILKVLPRTHLDAAHFKKLIWLTVEKIIIYIKRLLSYKLVKNMVPKYLINYFSLMRDNHSYFTRGSLTDVRPF